MSSFNTLSVYVVMQVVGCLLSLALKASAEIVKIMEGKGVFFERLLVRKKSLLANKMASNLVKMQTIK